MIVYLNAQIAAGAQAVQLFDSWVGSLGPDDYREYVLPFVKQVIAGITPGVPVISFATGNPQLMPLMAESGATVIGVDWRVRLDDAWQMIGPSERSKAISIRWRCWPIAPNCVAAPRTFCNKPPAGPATSSISATACCRKRRWTTLRRMARVSSDRV